MNDEDNEEKIEVVLAVRLPITCTLLTVLCDAVNKEYGGLYMRQTSDFLEFFRRRCRMSQASQEDIDIVEFWIDQWAEEIASVDENDREMYAEDRKVILSVRRLIANVKADRALRDEAN